MNPRWMRNSFIYLLIVVAVIAVFFTLFSGVGGPQEISFSEVVAMAKRGEVDTIEVSGDNLTVTTIRGENMTSRKGTGHRRLPNPPERWCRPHHLQHHHLLQWL